MTKIEDVDRVVCDFLKSLFKVGDDRVKVIKTATNNGGWYAEVEVYEESAFIKSIGLPTRVLDRNIYSVKLNDSLEVMSFERRGEVFAGEEL